MNRDLEMLRAQLTEQVVLAVPGAELVHFLPADKVAAGAGWNGTRLSSPEIDAALGRVCRGGRPEADKSWLVFFWTSPPSAGAAVVVQGDFLLSMSSDRLEPLTAQLSHQLNLTCQAAVDPASGLYNLRALHPVLEQLLAQRRSFLMACLGVSLAEMGPWADIGEWHRAITLLEAASSLPLFSLGGSVFAMVRDSCSPAEARDWARRCLRRLRRTGVSRAHIGMLLVTADEAGTASAEEVLNRCRLSYQEARRRGAMSLNLAGAPEEDIASPAAPPELDRLLRRGRGTRSCALAVLAGDGDAPLPAVISSGGRRSGQGKPGTRPAVSAPPSFHAVDDRHGFFYLPDCDAAAAEAFVRELRRKSRGRGQAGSFSCGVAVYPGAGGQARKHLPAQCRKALRHAGFFGPGSTVVFDAVSCNICGDWYYDRGDLWGAVREYRLGLRIVPDDVNLLNSLGVAWAELFEHRRAVRCFRRVLAKDLKNFMAWVNLGQSLVELGDEERALACFESALDTGGKEAAGMDVRTRCELLLQLGRIYGRRQRHREALALLERCRTECPQQEAQLVQLLALAHAGLGQQEQAVRCAQRAVQLRPDDASMLSLLGTLYLQGGQGRDIALSLCRQAVALAENDGECWLRLAGVLMQTGAADDEVRGVLQRCERLAPRHPALSVLKQQWCARKRQPKNGANFLNTPEHRP